MLHGGRHDAARVLARGPLGQHGLDAGQAVQDGEAPRRHHQGVEVAGLGALQIPAGVAVRALDEQLVEPGVAGLGEPGGSQQQDLKREAPSEQG